MSVFLHTVGVFQYPSSTQKISIPRYCQKSLQISSIKIWCSIQFPASLRLKNIFKMSPQCFAPAVRVWMFHLLPIQIQGKETRLVGRQEGQEFKANSSYLENLRPACAVQNPDYRKGKSHKFPCASSPFCTRGKQCPKKGPCFPSCILSIACSFVLFSYSTCNPLPKGQAACFNPTPGAVRGSLALIPWTYMKHMELVLQIKTQSP